MGAEKHEGEGGGDWRPLKRRWTSQNDWGGLRRRTLGAETLHLEKFSDKRGLIRMDRWTRNGRGEAWRRGTDTWLGNLSCQAIEKRRRREPKTIRKLILKNSRRQPSWLWRHLLLKKDSVSWNGRRNRFPSAGRPCVRELDRGTIRTTCNKHDDVRSPIRR